MVKKIIWYLNRLRRMTASEVMFRSNRFLTMQAERFWVRGTPHIPPISIDEEPGHWVSIPSLDSQQYIEEAKSILNGKMKLLWKEINGDFPPDWSRNPASGHAIPLTFGKTLDYRQTSVVGDIKYYWVLNRHHQLVTLAQAYALTKDSSYLKAIAELLHSWLDSNPYPKGANWTSALELAIRLINWSVTFQLCGGIKSALFDEEEGQQLKEKWLESIYLHLKFVRGHLSRHSSANNHLIGELSGLFVGTVTWPYWDTCSSDARFAQSELSKEVELQISPDGVSREQTIFYEHFVLEFLIYAGQAGKTATLPFEKQYWDRIEQVMAHWIAVRSCSGRLPSIGDGDDALVLPLANRQGENPHLAMLRFGAVLFRRPDFIFYENEPAQVAEWLIDDYEEKLNRLTQLPREYSDRRRSFLDGGYFILGDRFGDVDHEVLIVFDTGSLGYRSIAAHGHADALAFTLSVAGRDILVDPGTYAYQSDAEWREYFKSTSAHNTLKIDGQDQAVTGGKFLWLTEFTGKLEFFETNPNTDIAVGSHDGYQRLSDPVTHRRKLTFDKATMHLQVEDQLACKTRHATSAFWHFAPDVEVSATTKGLIAVKNGVSVEFKYSQGEQRVVSGSHNPILGWYSARFGQKEPTTTAILELEMDANERLITDIYIRIATC